MVPEREIVVKSDPKSSSRLGAVHLMVQNVKIFEAILDSFKNSDFVADVSHFMVLLRFTAIWDSFKNRYFAAEVVEF